MEEEIELRWHDLETEPVPGDGCVILFPLISDVGILYGLDNIYTPSNPEYARLNALRQEYTSWFPIPRHPKEDEVKKYIEKLYEHEHSEEEVFHKGFVRASENIVSYLKKIAPDNQDIINKVKEKFLTK